MADIKWSAYPSGGTLLSTDILVGLRGGANYQFNAISPGQVQSSAFNEGADSGSANAYAVTLTPAPTIGNGLTVLVLIANPNTTASTITVNGTTKNIVLSNNAALVGGELVAGQMAEFTYSSTYGAFILLNPANSFIGAAAALTRTNDTNVTITLGGTPAAALLQAVSLTMGWTGQLGLTRGGTNNSLTASAGGIVWSDASKLNILSGTTTANQILLSGNAATPAWSTTTYPATNAINTIMYASSANVLGVITPTNNGVLVYSAGGVPSSSTTLPSGLSATNMILTTPQIAQINDANGNAILTLTPAASAVNNVQVLNSATGNNVAVAAIGTDTDIAIENLAKGAGSIISGTTASNSAITYKTGTAYQHVSLFNFANTAATRTYTWPDASGTIGLNTDSTWTPTLKFGGGTTGITYTTQVGQYTQIGNTVTFSMFIVLSSKGSSSGNATITLPVAIRAGSNSYTFDIYPENITYSGQMKTSANSGASAMSFVSVASGGTGTVLTDTAFSNTSDFIITGSYLI